MVTPSQMNEWLDILHELPTAAFFWISTNVVAQGRRLVFADAAIAFEPPAHSSELEFQRKVRIMTEFEEKVALLYYYPNMQPDVIEALVASGYRGIVFAGTGLGVIPILIAGSPEIKERFLPSVASGERLCAFAITEAGAGSDAGGVRTTAVRDGDHYILNGTKQWISNAGEAEIYTVVALTDPSKGPRGASVIVVEKDTPGFSFGKKEDKMGIRASVTRELIFEDCRVPVENLLGREGTGFITATLIPRRCRQ